MLLYGVYTYHQLIAQNHQNEDVNGMTDKSNLLWKHCYKCETKRIPEGGIHMAPLKWLCAMCWKKRKKHEMS
jgi:hypothetical protein